MGESGVRARVYAACADGELGTVRQVAAAAACSVSSAHRVLQDLTDSGALEYRPARWAPSSEGRR